MQYFNAHIGLTDTLLEKLSKELKLTDQQVQQLVDDFMPQIQKNVLSMTKRGVQGYAIPKIVRDMAEQHIILPGYENAFRLFWDTPNKVWRSMVLTARPAWVANNVLGNVVFTAMQGGSLVRVGRQFVNPKYARLMEDIVPAEQAAGVGTGLFAAEGPGAATHLGAAAATGPGRFIDAATQTWHDTRGFRTMHQWGERIRNWNSEIENAFRRESFLTGVERQTAMAGTKRSLTRFSTSYQDLQKIAAKGIHPDIAEKALNEVNYFFNDYNSLGPFERGYIRRFALPFYSFFKHIVRLSTRYPMDFGLRNEVLTKLATFDNEMMRQMFGAQPAWMRGAYPIGPVGTPGGDQFFSGAAANPFSMLNPVASLSPMQLAYPLWKIAVETGMGRSTLTGRQFTDANVVVPFGTEQQYRIVTDSQGNVIDRIPINSVAPSIPESFAQQIPLYSLVKQLVAGGRTPSTETLPTVIKDRLLGRNPRELNAAGQALPFNALAALGAYVGLPTRQFDMAAYQANLARGGSEAAATYLKTHPPSGQATSVPPALRSQSSGGDPFAGLFG
jgi:hypothetical protein